MKSLKSVYPPIGMHIGHEYKFLYSEEILYLEAEGNYSRIKLENGKTIISSKNLKELENTLPEDFFFRIHHHSIINLTHIKRVIEEEQKVIVMSNGDHLVISRRKYPLLLEKFIKL